MTVRGAKYERRPLDDYPTPPEVTEVLFDHVRFSPIIVDPACGKDRKILKVAKRHGYMVVGNDIIKKRDFFDTMAVLGDVVTNPPFGAGGRLAHAFIVHALELTQPKGKVAMLLPADFDSGKTRQNVFDHPAFSSKIVLLDRIKWFNGKSGATNFAWYVFDWLNKGAPTIRYSRIY